MATVGSLVVNLLANTGAFSAGMKRAEMNVQSLKGSVAGAKSVIAGLGGALASVGIGLGGVALAKSAIHGFAEEQDAVAQLNAVLAATGGAAGLSSDAIRGLASELQNTTKYGDEATIKAASVLATFTNIKGDVFKEAIKSAQDMSTVLGTDLQGSVIQLGKALNDPTKGITALSKAGVSFTAEQKEQIATMQESGNVIGAQKLVLAELAKEFGGTSAAAAGTFNGKMIQMQNAVGDLTEKLGGMLTPFIGQMADAIKWLANSEGAFKVMAAGIGFAGGALLVYKGVAVATAAANIAMLAASGPAGWAALAVGAIAATAALGALNASMKGYEDQAVSATAKANEFRASQLAIPKASTDPIRIATNKVAGDFFRDQERGDAQSGMTDGQKKADDFKRKLTEMMNKNVASYDAMDSRQQASFRQRIADLGKQADMMGQAADDAANHAKIQEKLNELQRENAEFGKTASEKRLEELRGMKGITSEALRQAEVYQKAIAQKEKEKKLADDMKRRSEDTMKDMASAGQKVISDTMTPMEKYVRQIKDLGAQEAFGFIDEKTRARGSVQAFGAYREDSMKQYNPTAWIERGSQAEWSAINRSQQDPLSKMDQTALLQLTEAVQQTKNSGELVDIFRNIKSVSL